MNEQIAAAKTRQKANAMERARLHQGSKSGAAVKLTATSQSEVTEQPPNLYQVAKINIPDNIGDMTRLLHAELTKISQSQSIMLTLWEQLQKQKELTATLQQRLEGVENLGASALSILSHEGDVLSNHERRLRGLET